MVINIQTPILGIAAFSGTGKTTLLRQIIPLLRAKNVRLGLIKHSHHAFEIDRPAKDSYILARAGAVQTVVASARRTAIITQKNEADVEPTLWDFVKRLNAKNLDLILVEGFKHQPIPKIELHRPILGHPLLCLYDPSVIAVATDVPLANKINLPILDLNDPLAVANYIYAQITKQATIG